MAVTFLASLDQILNSQEETGAHLVFVNRCMCVLAGGEAGHEARRSRGTALGLVEPPRERGSVPLPQKSAELSVHTLLLLQFVHTQRIY